MINYITKYAGGKVKIEVSDVNDIEKLSTLYADGSEARVVDNNAGLYRLIGGIWQKIFGPESIEPRLLPVPSEEDAGKTAVVDSEGTYTLGYPKNVKIIKYHAATPTLPERFSVDGKICTYDEIQALYDKGAVFVGVPSSESSHQSPAFVRFTSQYDSESHQVIPCFVYTVPRYIIMNDSLSGIEIEHCRYRSDGQITRELKSVLFTA